MMEKIEVKVKTYRQSQQESLDYCRLNRPWETNRIKTLQRSLRDNLPFIAKVHRPILQSAAPSLRFGLTDGFGASPQSSGWAVFDMRPEDAATFEEAADELGLYFGTDNTYPGYVRRTVCKYVRKLD